MMQSNKYLTQPKISLLAAILCAVLTLSLWFFFGQKYFLASLIGLVAGFALYHASFGFTAGWRNIIITRRGGGLRMQFILIAAISIISYPLITYGAGVGLPVNAAIAPLSIALLCGAFMFGFGMMFGGGCGSGTLFTAGGGSTRMMIVLLAFIAGSLWGTHDLPWWRDLPNAPAISMTDSFGAVGALILLMSILGLISIWTIVAERKRHGALEPYRKTDNIFTGPWSPWLGMLALAAVSIACLLLLGRPWGITSAFALWGAKMATFIGIDVASWPYWQGRSALLERSIFADSTSVMNFAIMGGAMLASSLAGKYNPVWRISRTQLFTAIIGGLLMGYGARLAYGCNIGAYLGGIISGSVHGWIWMVAAFMGSIAALKIKAKFAW